MLHYDGCIITTDPDYRECIESGIEIEELYCKVYDEKDIELKRCLGEFNMMQCFEYDENTVESIESGIKRMMDSEYSYYQLEKKEIQFERTEVLFQRAVNFLRITLGDDIEKILQKELGMTDEEISDVLVEQQEELSEDMKLC